MKTASALTARIIRASVADVEAKSDSDNDPGYLVGMLAKYNNIDLGGDRIIPGAFEKSIRERVQARKVPLMCKHLAHGGSIEDVIGIITEARDTNDGLLVKAVFDTGERAQNCRRMINNKMIWGLSVGYRVRAWDHEQHPDHPDRFVTNLKECELVEGTVTVNPMNEEAIIFEAKSLSDKLVGSTFDSTDPLLLESINRMNGYLELLTKSTKPEVSSEAAKTVKVLSTDENEIVKRKLQLNAITLANLRG